MVETTMDNLPRIYRGIYGGRPIATAEHLYQLPEGLQDGILHLALWVAKMESLSFAGLLRPLLRQIKSLSINSESPTIVDTYSFASKYQPINTDFAKSYGIDTVESYEHFLVHHEKMQPILKDLVSIVESADRIQHKKKLIQVMAELVQYHQELSIIQELNPLIS